MEEEDPDVLPIQPPALFLDTQWYRIILDEAQVIKNRSTLTARAMFALHAKYRWSLSGTPMQNGIEEMFSQLSYLRIRPYHDWQKFHLTFMNGLNFPHSRKTAMQKFQTLLKAILLRRTKQSKIDGVEIIKDLPGKEITIVHAEFDEEQLEFYQALEAGAVIELKRYRDAGTLGKNISRGLVLLLRLRQACLHPRLVTQAEKVKGGSAELTIEQQVLLAREFTPQTVRRVQEIKSFECSVCLDIFLNPTLVFPCGHHVFPYIASGWYDANEREQFCVDCIASCFDTEKEDALARGEEYDAKKTKCPDCRVCPDPAAPFDDQGAMDPTRMVSLEAFREAHPTEEEKQSKEAAANESYSDVDSSDEGDWLFTDDRKRKANQKGSKDKAAKKRKSHKADLITDWITSAKIDKLCEILENIRREDPAEKAIVFSQFTGFLDLIHHALEERNFKFGRVYYIFSHFLDRVV